MTKFLSYKVILIIPMCVVLASLFPPLYEIFFLMIATELLMSGQVPSSVRSLFLHTTSLISLLSFEDCSYLQ